MIDGMTRALVQGALICSVACASLNAQEDSGPAVGAPKTEPLAMNFYKPKNLTASALVAAVSNLTHPRVSYIDQNTHQLQSVIRFYPFGDSIVIREHANAMEDAVKFLMMLDEQRAGKPGNADPPSLAEFSYTPRFISTGSVMKALIPFQRTVPVIDTDQNAGLVSNITLIGEERVVLIRERPDQIGRIFDFLASIDLPQPQVTIMCYLVTASKDEAAESDSRIPKEVTTNLAKLLPFSSFELTKIGLLRTSVATEQQIRMQMSENNVSYELVIQPSAFDDSTGQLTLSKCTFQTGFESFQTSLSLHADEYTVLGAVGASPIFVVLRVVTEKRPS